MKIDIVKLHSSHLEHIAANMRPEDVREIWLADRSSPIGALEICNIMSDKKFALLLEGEPVLAFGLERDGLSDNARGWLLATPQIAQVRRFFLQQSKPIFLSLTKEYALVYNYVHEQNTVALRWLKWLGFEIHPAIPFGAESAQFHRVEFVRK